MLYFCSFIPLVFSSRCFYFGENTEGQKTMEIKRYRDIKRGLRKRASPTCISMDEARELLQLLDDYRDFNNHLLAYMTIGMTTKFRDYYDVLAAAKALAERIK